jgi:hypothetical protein
MSWSLDAHDLDLLAVQADERLLTAVGARRQVEVADPVIAVLAALAREVDARPVPTVRLAGLRPVGQPAGTGRRANRRAALTGVAAAVAVLCIGGVAATVGGTPVSSVIRETVGSVFNGDSSPSTADLISAKLGEAKAALARGDAEQAKQILEDINAQVEDSDPGEVPPGLVEQIKQLESQVEQLESQVDPGDVPPLAPAVTSSPSSIVPAGTNGADASQPAGSETQGNGNGRGTNQGQGQGTNDDQDEATPTSEPTSAPTTTSPDPTSSPSAEDEDPAPHGKGPNEDSGESAQAAGGQAAASPSVLEPAEKPAPRSERHYKGDYNRSAEAASNEVAEQVAPITRP